MKCENKNKKETISESSFSEYNFVPFCDENKFWNVNTSHKSKILISNQLYWYYPCKRQDAGLDGLQNFYY